MAFIVRYSCFLSVNFAAICGVLGGLWQSSALCVRIFPFFSSDAVCVWCNFVEHLWETLQEVAVGSISAVGQVREELNGPTS